MKSDAPQFVKLDAPVGKKSMPEYTENPSISARQTRTGTRRIFNKASNKIVVIDDSGEAITDAVFHEIIEVDQEAFTKIYISGVRLFHDLSSPGVKVFELLLKVTITNPTTDQVYLHPKLAPTLSRPTFDRGIVELLAKEILYKTVRPSHYYVNINYLFTGDRVTLVKDYRVKTEERGSSEPASS